MVEPSSTAGQDIGLIYAEKRCALTWPLLLTGLVATVVGGVLVLLCGLYGFLINRAFFVAEAAALGWTVFWARLLRSRWPTGIRVDAAGIRIGDARALRFATTESYTVFACPWTLVRRILVIETGSRRSRARRRQGAASDDSASRSGDVRPHWLRWLGWLIRLLSPVAGASIYLYLDPDTPGGPQAQRVGNVYSFGSPATVWMAPTRHPKALRAALAQLPGCPPVGDDFSPDAPFPPRGR